jgi:hypothetical protein
MDLDRGVLGRYDFLLHIVFSPIAQVEDVGLDPGEERIPARFDVEVLLGDRKIGSSFGIIELPRGSGRI